MKPSNNTETEEESIASNTKMLRRVSFADNVIASVHVFRRDDSSSSSGTPLNSSVLDPEIVGFFRYGSAVSTHHDVDFHGSVSASFIKPRSNKASRAGPRADTSKTTKAHRFAPRANPLRATETQRNEPCGRGGSYRTQLPNRSYRSRSPWRSYMTTTSALQRVHQQIMEMLSRLPRRSYMTTTSARRREHQQIMGLLRTQTALLEQLRKGRR